MTTHQIQKQFFDQLCENEPFRVLFSHLPDVYFFVKNTHSQFIQVNRNMISQCGCEDESEMLGKTDFDFFPLELAQEYVTDDRRVTRKGITIINKLELVRNKEGAFNWFTTTKVPLRNRDGKIIGLAGHTRDMRETCGSWKPVERMAPIVEYIRSNLYQPIAIPDLARQACLSVSQFERRFRKLFNTSPGRYILKMRILSACRELADTDASISQIALKVGFYDHSAFTRTFTRLIGISPREYRKRFLPLNATMSSY